MQNNSPETAAAIKAFEARSEVPFTDIRTSFEYACRKKNVSSRKVQQDMLAACSTELEKLELLDHLIGYLPSVLNVIEEIRCPKAKKGEGPKNEGEVSEWLARAARSLSVRTHSAQVKKNRQRQQTDRRFREITGAPELKIFSS
jgi:hypothetical protein